MRLLRPSFVLLLAACGSGEPGASDKPEAPPPAANVSMSDELVECTSGAAAFERACMIEQVRDEEGLVLVLRAPDGGFRRLRVTKDGRGVVAADGAEPAEVVPLNQGLIEVRIGRDRYRLPATVRAPAS